jgi:RHS repeat-associated protein
MTNDGSNTLVYDGENRVVSATNGTSSGTYTYDGNGIRVQKVSGGTTAVYIYAGSKPIAEYWNGVAVNSPSRESIYAGGQLITTFGAVDGSMATTYRHQDHLSIRISTDGTSGSPTYGQVVGTQGHFPFGETWYSSNLVSKYEFTTYERDPESSNDYAQARYNVSRLGRFSSPDPISGSTSDPQSLNRYSYVRNMPVTLTDPFGLFPGGCVPVAKHSDQDNKSSDSGRGQGPYDSSSGDWNPEPQGDCANGVDNGGGGGGTLDGIPFGDIPGGLIGNGESNTTFVVPLGDSLGFNSWVTDPFGNGWQNPTTGCDTTSGLYCPSMEDEGSAEGGYGNSELDLYSVNNPSASSRGALVFLAAVFKASSNCAKILGGLPQALRLGNGAQLAAIDAPGFVMPTDPDAVGVVQALTPDANGTVLAAGGVSFVGNPNWNGQSFTIYTNSDYAGFNTAQQLTLIIHELHHVALGHTDASRALDWGDTGASPDIQNIAKQCHTGVPPGQGPQ